MQGGRLASTDSSLSGTPGRGAGGIPALEAGESTGDLGAEIETLSRRLAQVRVNIGQIIFGQEETVEQSLIGLLAGGHVLLIGVPGLAKTRLVDCLGRVLGLDTKRVQLSPDGRRALVRSIGSLGRDISGFELGPDRPAVPLVATPADEASFSFSPDGRWLLYAERDGDRTEIVVRPFPATNSARHQVSPRGGFAPLWSRDGRELFYLSRDREMMVVAFSVVGGEPRFGVPRPLFRLPEQYLAGPEEYYTTYDISLDGQRFLMARAVEQSASAVPTLLVFEHIDREIDRALRGARRPER